VSPCIRKGVRKISHSPGLTPTARQHLCACTALYTSSATTLYIGLPVYKLYCVGPPRAMPGTWSKLLDIEEEEDEDTLLTLALVVAATKRKRRHRWWVHTMRVRVGNACTNYQYHHVVSVCTVYASVTSKSYGRIATWSDSSALFFLRMRIRIKGDIALATTIEPPLP